MVYTTGSRDDWDYISRVTEDPSWAWDAMGPYRDRNQGYVAPNDGHDDVSQKQLSPFLRSYPVHPRRINTSHRHTVATGRYASAFPGQRGLLTRELWQRLMNRVFRPSFPSNGT